MAVTGGTKQENEELYFQTGHTYLLKFSSNYDLYEAKVLQLTDKAVKFQRFRSDGSSYTEWMMIKEFNSKYTIFEELPEQVLPYEKVPIEEAAKFYDEMSEKCPICNGEGEIPDSGATAGKKLCPKCWGSKRIWKT